MGKPLGRPDLRDHAMPGRDYGNDVNYSRRRFWYTRLGMLPQYNPWGDAEWSQNYYTWRCEARIALTVPRPSAINIVTGFSTN